MGVQPYFQTLKSPVALGGPVFTATPTPSNMPAPQTRLFYAWLNAYAEWFKAQCPLARTTTYYVSTSGSDANDGLSPGAAFQTLTKVNTVINASSGDIRIRLRRGDIFRITSTGTTPNVDIRGILINKNNVTIDDYTDETSTGTSRSRKPVITPFIALAAASWTLDGVLTNSYKYTITALTGAVNAVAWVRETLETSEDRVFTRVNSAAVVDTTPGSFYYDPAANLLWLRPFANGLTPTSSFHRGYEYVPQFRTADMPTTNCLPAISSTNVTGTRIHGIRIDGWMPTWNDISTAAGTQAVRLDFDGTNVGLLTEVEAYYSHQHILMKGDTGSAGGYFACIGCRTSGHFAQESGNSRQAQDHLMSYSSLGGNIGFFMDCEGVMGRLPSVTYNDFTKQGQYIRCHTNGATNPALMIAYRCRIKPNQWQPQSFGTFANMAVWGSDMSAARAFKVQCDFPSRPPTALDATWWANATTDCVVYNTGWDGVDTVWVGCRGVTKSMRACSSATLSGYQNGNSAAQTFINCDWLYDISMTKGDVAKWGIGTANARWYFSRFRFKVSTASGSSTPQFGIGSAYSAGNTWANSAQNLKVMGTILEIAQQTGVDNSRVFVSGLGNNLDSGGSVLTGSNVRESTNAWAGGWTSSGTASDYWGFCNTTSFITAAALERRPNTDSVLVVASVPQVEGVTLEHDMFGQARSSTYPTIGPVQAMPYASQPVYSFSA